MNGDRASQPAEPAGPDDGRSTTPGTLQRALPIYYALLFAILTVVGIYLLFQLKHVLMILFISLLFAAATASPAAQLQRLRIPQAVSVTVVYLVALAVVVGIAWYVLPPLFGQVASLTDEIPHYVERYHQLQQTYEEIRARYPELGSFDSQVNQIGGRLLEGIGRRLTALPSQLFGVFLDVLSVFVISILLVTTRHRLLDFTLTMVHPRHRDTTRVVLEKMWQRVGHYLRAKLIVMTIVATITYIALLLLQIPFPLLLAIVVGLGEAIPRAGPWLARLPLLAIAATQGWELLVAVFVVSVVIENLKGYLISPLVEGDQLDIHPLLVFVAVLVGSSLLGVAGAFVAVPAAAMIQVVFDEVIIPWRRGQLTGAEARAAQPAPHPNDASVR